jgi:hypothetical protein
VDIAKVVMPDKDDAMVTLRERSMLRIAVLPNAVLEIAGYSDVESGAALIGQDIDEVIVLHSSLGRMFQKPNRVRRKTIGDVSTPLRFASFNMAAFLALEIHQSACVFFLL